MHKLSPYLRLMRVDKPIGYLLLLWPTLWGLVLAANGQHNPKIIFIFVLGVALMRSAGCVINDIADRNIDGKVKRTKSRPIASGELSVKQAMVLFILLVVFAFIAVLQLNLATILMSFVALVLATSYPFAKRYTNLPQAHLGIAFAWAIPMTYTAYGTKLGIVCWLLFAATVVWALIYDTMYAMVDRDDDLKVGVKSTAVLFGKYDIAIIIALQIMFIAMLAAVGMLLGMGIIYSISLFVVVILFMAQIKKIWMREREQCFRAFLNNHWVGMMVFIGVVLS